ncbi:MAG: rhamnulokinase [Chloroflexi bacterium]|nr:rhamnulokinase [Chloroflexota bacterium]
MSPNSHYLAFDLGAESGRAVVGLLGDKGLALSTLHRFPNGPVRVFEHLYWDVLRLFGEIKNALGMYRLEYGPTLGGIGVDTWGVDLALLGRDDQLLGNPHHYRDPRTVGMLKEAFRLVPREEIFQYTGIQFMEINSLYQLLAMKRRGDPALEQAKALLMMPDLFNFWLTGIKACEFSDATTTQFYDPRARDWARPLLAKLGLPTHFLQEIVPPGTVLGTLHPSVAEETGLDSVPVIAPACHDTGSAVAAVPARGRDFAYISSGTWSLMGVEIPEPVISAESLAFNFTNEGGVCGTFRLLKNIMGLWLVQECRRAWAHEGDELSYDEITALAAKATPFGPLIEPDSVEFLRPGDMPRRIQDFCRRTGQRVPETKGEIARCALESLALKYRWALEKLEKMLGRRLEVIHVVGGGSQNRLLCQLTADATGRPVVGGPVEATAIGNILMQILAQGQIASLAEGRELVRRSFETIDYEPTSPKAWDEAYERFIELRHQVPEVQ